MGGERHDGGAGAIASFFLVFVGVPLILFLMVGIIVALFAVTVGLP